MRFQKIEKKPNLSGGPSQQTWYDIDGGSACLELGSKNHLSWPG